MLLEPTPDQDFFRDTTARFLQERTPVAVLRGLRDDAAGYDSDFWRAGAELGWTSLLVDEEHGGGSISDSGLLDLTLIAYEFGRRAAPGPLVPTNIVAALLGRHDSHPDTLAGLLDGSVTGAWCTAEPAPGARAATAALEITVDGDEVIVHGTKRPVEAAGTAEVLLVTGRTGEGLSHVLVPRDTPGVTITAMRSVDLTRRYAKVDFDGVRLPASALLGAAGDGAADAEYARHLAIVLGCAETVGALQTAFDTTVAWAFDRYSFGRALASYQAIKHRFADMKMWLEACHAISDAAAAAVAVDAPDAARLASAAKAYVGDHAADLMQECVQFHGGIGLTFEHDLHLYTRRVAANRSTYGTPAEHRGALADAVIAAAATSKESAQ
ncbi:acyl-CoA dehydrogenase family protein [Rhodococcus sp. NPDC060090]|uniref:acyl-CoA dehydrogenase family protein n=1 Tax=Rhodococcus sp. NPDC060090 TaxID=3347056 RepID=UPI0036460BA4